LWRRVFSAWVRHRSGGGGEDRQRGQQGRAGGAADRPQRHRGPAKPPARASGRDRQDPRPINEGSRSDPPYRRPPAPWHWQKLQRINADLARVYPPDGDAKLWWPRLKNALGTTSSDFVNASLFQLQAAARLPGGGLSETAVNAALAMIEAAQPRDEIEGALAAQMACTHTAAMAVIARLGNGYGGERRLAALGSAAARLLKVYAIQVEVLRRRRHGGHQYVRVEHVYVSDGGQAIIGNVKGQEFGLDNSSRYSQIMNDWFINIACGWQVPPQRLSRLAPEIVSIFPGTANGRPQGWRTFHQI
jgi:hypothetical protein